MSDIVGMNKPPPVRHLVFLEPLSAHPTLDGGTKRQIRKQGAAHGWRARASKSKPHNRYNRSYAPLLPAKTKDTPDDRPPKEKAAQPTSTVSRPLPSKGYEKLRIRYNADIVDLSFMADMDIGRAAVRVLHLQGLPTVLRQKSQTYLSFLPSRYGHNACLDAAIECVTSRLSSISSNKGETRTTYVLYGQALQIMRRAIYEEKIYNADVLCASQLLGLFEVCPFQVVPHCVAYVSLW